MFVDTATKWRPIAAASPVRAMNQRRAVSAFCRVSCVVKVFEAITNSVVWGWTTARVSAMSVGSTLETKWTRRPRF